MCVNRFVAGRFDIDPEFISADSLDSEDALAPSISAAL
jgi:hypothetical protein